MNLEDVIDPEAVNRVHSLQQDEWSLSKPTFGEEGLECGVVLKRDMPDGWTETTWSYNIGKVKSIYERNGGILV